MPFPPSPPGPAHTKTFLHSWLPVGAALLLAVAAGWSVMALNSWSDRASHDAGVPPTLAADMSRPETLLLVTAARRLTATGPTALDATPGAPPHMGAYYTETIARLEQVGRSSGEQHLARTAVRRLTALAETQDAVYAGGAASRSASTRAPATVEGLRSGLAALDSRLQAQARIKSRVSHAGTMLIMLGAALSLIVLLRRSDRMRGRLTEELHRQATHDPLTGLANRRQLASDLVRVTRVATSDRPARLVVFDLDGFKSYNDSFGHHGGDLLLQRLGGALATSSAPQGTSYRLGGDEFCTLFEQGADEHVIDRCLEALSEVGDGFAIASSHGSVLIPTEAGDPDLAMQLADERMYARKDSSRASAGQQSRNLALKVLSVQEPDVEHHSAHVALLAAGVGRRLGLSDGENAELVRAAELHDLGKIAIPYAVLHKPTALDEQEWEMMRRHPTIGANILSAAPALGQVAEIVRASHERYDGLGYPAGLAGDEIPLASRIVFVCDSFDAMSSARPYSPPMSDEGALDELRRGAGAQFDPVVVSAFCDELHAQRQLARAAPSSATHAGDRFAA